MWSDLWWRPNEWNCSTVLYSLYTIWGKAVSLCDIDLNPQLFSTCWAQFNRFIMEGLSLAYQHVAKFIVKQKDASLFCCFFSMFLANHLTTTLTSTSHTWCRARQKMYATHPSSPQIRSHMGISMFMPCQKCAKNAQKYAKMRKNAQRYAQRYAQCK